MFLSIVIPFFSRRNSSCDDVSRNPTDEQETSVGVLFLSTVSGRLTQRIQEDEADLSQREKT